MTFLTRNDGRSAGLAAFIFVALTLILSPLTAQTNTAPVLEPLPSLTVTTDAPTLSLPENAHPIPHAAPSPDGRPHWPVLVALISFACVGGILLFQSGLTRAKNCAHSATLLLVGIMFGLTGYWMGGFAVQTGGVGDAHAALSEAIPHASRNALDHELGFLFNGHHFGLMGSSGFFLTIDPSELESIAEVFLIQVALVALAIATALGGALERGKIAAFGIFAFLIGSLIYPLLANWVWGGGWLAELGREFGLGHGFVDFAGAGVVHATAGTLALVIAIVLGPRLGRFDSGKPARLIPGHHLPFVVLGVLVLMVARTAGNVVASGDIVSATPLAGLAGANMLLAGMAGTVTAYFLAVSQGRRPEPPRLGRGLMAGIVALCACSALVDPWAAFAIGGISAVLVQVSAEFLERKRIDDPVSAAMINGMGGLWGLLATGLFANGAAGSGLNGVEGGVRGLFFGGGWHQLAAQAIGAASGFVIVFGLGYVSLVLVHKIMGLRVSPADEMAGLDAPQTGALGYQGDIDLEEESR